MQCRYRFWSRRGNIVSPLLRRRLVRHHNLPSHVLVAASAKNIAVKRKRSDLVWDESNSTHFSRLYLSLQFQVRYLEPMNPVESSELQHDRYVELDCNY